MHRARYAFFFFFNDTATTEIYTLSLHDALPISEQPDLALVRRDDIHDHTDRRRLPGAVRAEQPEDHCARDRERQRVDRGVTGEAFGDSVEHDEGAVHAAVIWRGRGKKEGDRPPTASQHP